MFINFCWKNPYVLKIVFEAEQKCVELVGHKRNCKLSAEYLLAKIGSGKAEDSPSKVFVPYLRQRILAAAQRDHAQGREGEERTDEQRH